MKAALMTNVPSTTITNQANKSWRPTNTSSLFINIGTTTEEVARALVHHQGLLVITNNIHVAQTLLPKIGGGRLAAYEILVVTSGIANLIRENKTFRITSVIQTGAKKGMRLMDDSLYNLWKKGDCAKEEVLERSVYPDELSARIAKAESGVFDDEA